MGIWPRAGHDLDSGYPRTDGVFRGLVSPVAVQGLEIRALDLLLLDAILDRLLRLRLMAEIVPDRSRGFIYICLTMSFNDKGESGAMCVRCVRKVHTLAEPLAGSITENLIKGDN